MFFLKLTVNEKYNLHDCVNKHTLRTCHCHRRCISQQH